MNRAARILTLPALLAALLPLQASGQLLHLWDFDEGAELVDSAGAAHLIVAPGEGDVNGTFGTAGDLVFEPGINGGQAYRPFYVDSNASSTAGVGLTGGPLVNPVRFTIEAILRADAKTSLGAVNYIFYFRPGSDRGYYLIQDDDNLDGGSVGGIGTIIGSSFSEVGIGAQYTSDGTWLYVAAVIDLSPASTAVADLYAANLSLGQTTPVLLVDDRTWNTADPDALTGAVGFFGVGGFAIDRDGDHVAEASQEWFQGAIDYIAIYNGLLSPQDLQANLEYRLTRIFEDGFESGGTSAWSATVD